MAKTWLKIKKKIKKYTWLVNAKRKIWNKYFNDQPNIIKDVRHVRKKIKKSHNSGVYDAGIVIGSTGENKYLLKFEGYNLVERHVAVKGVWEPSLYTLYKFFLKQTSKSIFIDVGANIGATSIPLAVDFHNNTFLPIEANRFAFEKLKENLLLNNLNNVMPIFGAATSSSETHVTFFEQSVENENLGLSSLYQNDDIENYSVVKVPVVNIDDLDIDKADVAIIKIDVQGAEFDVLKAAKKIIKQSRPCIFFEYESQYIRENETALQDEIRSFFNSINYKLYAIDIEKNLLLSVELDGYFHGDILALPNI